MDLVRAFESIEYDDASGAGFDRALFASIVRASKNPMVEHLLTASRLPWSIACAAIRDLLWFEAKAPCRTLDGVSGPYMRRYDLGDGPDGSHLYVHEILRADEDKELHTHPWSFVALGLVDGYFEERWDGTKRIRIKRERGFIYALDANTPHRIAETAGAWTLVITSPKRGSWEFIDPEQNARTPWREFLKKKGLLQ